MKCVAGEVLKDPSFWGALIGAVLSSIIAILIYKHGNKNERKNQKINLLSRKLYLFEIFKDTLNRLKTSMEIMEREERIIEHIQQAKRYFLLFDDKVLSEKENENLLLWHELVIQIEYTITATACSPDDLKNIINKMNNLLVVTTNISNELRTELNKII